jgi:D-alanyl-lipoteichoic acid acyltransferase DltB (MBOAT superfamily)
VLFNSFIFLAFFAAFYPVHLLLQRFHRAQNYWLLAGGYVFYGYWDLRFLALLIGSTTADFFIGRAIGRTERPGARRWLLVASLIVNLGVLGFFKYFNFFEANFVALLRSVGIAADPITLSIVLPVGVSFYTFQSIGYIIDVYRGHVAPIRRLDDYALFVAFFPQLMAGPIERAGHLIPQVMGPRRIEAAQVQAGLALLLLGYFKKVVVADHVAAIADAVFNGHEQYRGMDLTVAALAFTVQIYADFSGYSDIARGLAKLLGFDLMVNFKLPYFAASPSEFWQRWHVSLSTWLRDYLYIPLGGNRGGELRTIRNLILTMLLGGLWHGAAWNFVLWGGFHGVLLVLYRWFDRGAQRSAVLPVRVLRIALMFCLTVFGWVLFRATSFEQIAYFASHAGIERSADTLRFAQILLACALPLFAIETLQHLRRDLLALTKLWLPVRVGVFSALLVAIAIFAVREQTEFIYFQF